MGRIRKRRRCRSKSCVRSRKRRLLLLVANGHTCSQGRHHHYHRPTVSLFEEYLKSQNWLPEREHWDFLSALRRPLPVCFRIRNHGINTTAGSSLDSGTATIANELDRLLRQELGLHRFHHQIKKWPDHTWQLPASILTEHPCIREWLVSQTAKGHVSRQELVSMIPVWLLDIQPHHRVLDLCASPGSKTMQAVDALYSRADTGACTLDSTNQRDPHPQSSPPSGFVIANELDPRRAYVLTHRCCGRGEGHTPTAAAEAIHKQSMSLAITCHNACKFPNLLAPLEKKNPQKGDRLIPTAARSTLPRQKPFDRVICDVPCSGDGTCRKDLKVWKTWHPSYGIQLHSLQLRIAKRGIHLLQVGGMMTYSTCSFHPVENEAVVAALLETGCVEVVDCTHSTKLKGLRRRDGLTHWKVLDDACCERWLESSNSSTGRQRRDQQWPRTLWPPSNPKYQASLRKCIRMVPHDNDSGGFFIALLRKIQDFPCPKTKENNSYKALDMSSSCNNARASNATRTPATPQAEHHKLFPVLENSKAESTGKDGHKTFTRGPSASGKRQFQISTHLARYLTDSPGSDKVNLVYSGYCPPPSPFPVSLIGRYGSSCLRMKVVSLLNAVALCFKCVW